MKFIGKVRSMTTGEIMSYAESESLSDLKDTVDREAIRISKYIDVSVMIKDETNEILLVYIKKGVTL